MSEIKPRIRQLLNTTTRDIVDKIPGGRAALYQLTAKDLYQRIIQATPKNLTSNQRVVADYLIANEDEAIGLINDAMDEVLLRSPGSVMRQMKQLLLSAINDSVKASGMDITALGDLNANTLLTEVSEGLDDLMDNAKTDKGREAAKAMIDILNDPTERADLLGFIQELFNVLVKHVKQ